MPENKDKATASATQTWCLVSSFPGPPLSGLQGECQHPMECRKSPPRSVLLRKLGGTFSRSSTFTCTFLKTGEDSSHTGYLITPVPWPRGATAGGVVNDCSASSSSHLSILHILLWRLSLGLCWDVLHLEWRYWFFSMPLGSSSRYSQYTR